ncbi:MAG: YfhO family protein, partial [Eubacterium sp.]|nr:YfhO family protein [Eubacterium sp.]
MTCLIINRCIPYGDNFPIGGIGFTQAYSWFVDSINEIKSGKNPGVLDYTQGLVSDKYDTNAYALLYMIVRPWLFVILKFVPESMYVIFFALSYYLYFLSSGPAFIYYLTHRRIGEKIELNDYKLVLLGLMYTMSTYSTAYFIYQGFKYMVFVPIILLGLERIVYDKKPVLYVVALFFMMATDAYSSFILCIFIVMYFCTLQYEGLKDFIYKSARMAIWSVCSAGLAAFSLIPFYLRTRYSPYESGDSSIPSIFSWFGNILFSISDFSPFREGIITTPQEYRANIYCGLVAFLVLPLYFFIKKYDRITKIKKAVFILIVYLSFDNQLINYIFHGFHHQWQVPNRYACFFVFIILCILADILVNLESLSSKEILGSVFSSGILLIVSYVITGINSIEQDSSLRYFIPGLIFIGIYLTIAVIYAFKSNKTIIIKCIYALTCVEIIASCFVSLKFSTNTAGTEETMNYVQQMKAFSNLYDDIDSPFVITERPGTNDNQNIACLTDTNSISYYGSTGYKQFQDLLHCWGVLFSTNLTYYTNGSPLADMMLHVKYHVTDSEDVFTSSPYNVVATSDKLLLHENEYSLPLGIVLSDNDMLDQWGDKSGSNDNYLTPFDRENEFAHCFGVDDIYNIIQIKEIKGVEEAVSSEENYYFVSEDESGGATFVFLIGEEVSGSLYLQASNSIQYVGTATEENCDTLYFYAPRTIYNVIKEGTSFGIWNEKNFAQLYNILQSNVMTEQKYDTDTISGRVDVSEQGMLYLAVPALPGFEAYVDGNKQEIINYLDGIGIELSEGEHIIKLKYTPKGMWLGIIISVISLVGFGIFVVRSGVICFIKDTSDDSNEKAEENQKSENKNKLNNKILKYSLTFGICIVFFILFIILGYVRYERNDDTGFNTIAAGYMGPNSERLFFINVIYGYFLKLLYLITNDINWYLWCMLFLSLISVITLCIVLERRINSIIYSVFITVLINVILGKQLYNLLQFTKLASVLMIAGFFVISCTYEENNRKKRLALNVIGMILFVT